MVKIRNYQAMSARLLDTDLYLKVLLISLQKHPLLQFVVKTQSVAKDERA